MTVRRAVCERWVGVAVRRSCAQVSRAARCAKYGVGFMCVQESRKSGQCKIKDEEKVWFNAKDS